jgi:hypothetical protein
MEALSIAAEKYKVYTAMNVCKIYMKSAFPTQISFLLIPTHTVLFNRKTLPEHVSSILGYAARYKYTDILNLAIPLVINRPLAETVAVLPSDYVVPWVGVYSRYGLLGYQLKFLISQIQYYDQWTRVAQNALQFNFQDTARPKFLASYECSGCCRVRAVRGADRLEVIRKLGMGALALKDLDSTFKSEENGCAVEKEAMQSWRRSVEEAIKGIKPFSEFCK